MLGGQSTTASHPQPVQGSAVGGGKKGQVSLNSSAWAGTWDVLQSPPMLRLQACLPLSSSFISMRDSLFLLNNISFFNSQESPRMHGYNQNGAQCGGHTCNPSTQEAEAGRSL